MMLMMPEMKRNYIHIIRSARGRKQKLFLRNQASKLGWQQTFL
jgi:hypothetical protein